MPITPEREDLDRRRGVGGIVFGTQDGVLTALAAISGMSAATNPHTAALSAIVATIGGAISMGVGAYLDSRAELDVVAATIAEEQERLSSDPAGEYLEMVTFYQTKGFPENEARSIACRMLDNPTVWEAEMLRDEYGIDHLENDPSAPVKNALTMGTSFGVGAGIPTLVYLALPNLVWLAIAVALVVLVAVGAVVGTISKSSPVVWALRLLISGSALAGATAAAGAYLAR